MWCALVFSSNCSMARSARKIFQNKAIDGNYISTLGTDGMWTLSVLCKKHPSIRQTHVIVACRDGTWGWRWDPRRPLLRLEVLHWGGGGAVTETGGQEGYPGIYLPCLTLEGLSPSPAREPDSLKALPGWRSVAWQSEQASGTSRAGCHGPLSGSGEKTLTKAGKGVLTYNVCPGHF